MTYNIVSYLSKFNHAYFITTVFFTLSIIITSLEYLAIGKEFSEKGVFSWKILSTSESFQRNVLFKKLDFLFDYKAVIFLHLLKLLGVILFFISSNYIIKSVSITTVTLCLTIFSIRNIFGNDGADQMQFIISISLFFAFYCDNEFVYKISLWFIAIQSIISYVIAGIAKLSSKKWRTGKAVLQIMNTRTFGNQKIANVLSSAPNYINMILNWLIGVASRNGI